mmetsp:Transcript_38591/g.123691  ORF Transcript_38591/g.123691 Transcript_38591/m.123691 type:complete len:119 (-) Transcript_38591:141-497(-)
MSRSLGDQAAKAIGVVATPDVVEVPIPHDCRRAIITLCSDGYSDVIDLESLHTAVLKPLLSSSSPHSDDDASLSRLADDVALKVADLDRQAELTWCLESPDNYVDDRSIGVILLHKNS